MSRKTTLVEYALLKLYFIKINRKKGPIKVGVTMDIDERLRSLQTANPYELKVLASICCKSKRHAFELEQDIHVKLKRYRVRGEWFSHEIEKEIPKILARDMEYINSKSRAGRKSRYTLTLG